MAVLQKIRGKGVLLLIIVGIGLFAFIGEELVRSIGTAENQRRQVVGEVYGETISSQEFQDLLTQYEEALKFMRGTSSLSDEETTQAQDQVWQMYVNYKLIKHEADKLGLTVTDKELQDVLAAGDHPMLQQTPFVNQQTHRFDANMLKNFLTEYEKMQTSQQEIPEQYREQYTNIYNYWKFVEKTLRESLLEQKYQILLSATILSNPVEAKMAYEGITKSANLQLVSLPYTLVSDNKVKITDADLQKKYEENKELYRQEVESRDIKYVSVAVKASAKDKADLDREMATYAQKVNQTQDLTGLVRMSNSVIAYNNIPVTKSALPVDIQQQLDSISVGTLKGPYYEPSDNSDNIIKLVSKMQAPDSVQVRMIQVGGATAEAAHKSADSIYAAIKGGAPFDSIAKRYKQQAQKQWLVSNQYENGQIDEDNAKMLNAVNEMAAGEIRNMEFAQGNIILQVTDRRAMTTKYNVAVIKRPVTFSKDTYTKAYNNFSRYLSMSPTLADLQKNAPKFGYTVETREDLYSNEHYVANVTNTRDAMRWIFDSKTNPGDVSQLYECGNNDHLLAVVLTKVHKAGYRPLEDVKEIVRAEVLKDKKAEVLENRLKGVRSVAQASAIKGAIVDSLNHVTFATNSFVRATGTTEPKINGSVWHKKAGQFVGPIQGNNGVYVYQVLSTATDSKAKFNEAEYENQARAEHLRNMSAFGGDLYIDGKVVDKRYLFF